MLKKDKHECFRIFKGDRWTRLLGSRIPEGSKVRGFSITHNQTGILAKYNIENLLAELTELDQEAFNIEYTGFQAQEISDLLIENQPEDLDKLLQEIDVSMAVEKPLWAVIRTGTENKEALEMAMTQLELQGIKVERSYKK